ncbi:MAG: MBL fold metallo-hydrolase [Chloroflexota bacterium]
MTIQPLLSKQHFLDDVASAQTETNQCHVWWLGQSGFLVQWQNKHLLLDPYLSDSLTKKYAETDKPHIRMTDHVIQPEQLDFIQVATSSHNHTDHLDGETLAPLMKVNPSLKLVIPEANRIFVSNRLGCANDWPLGLTDGERITIDGFTFTGIPAAHNDLETDEAGRHKFMGYIVEFGPWTLYHSGDTLWYDDLLTKLAPWPRVDLAILPINGNKPERRVAGNLNGREAAQVAKKMGAQCVIPCHFEMFTFNTASPDEFITEAANLGQPYRVLRAGERWTSSK